MAKTIGVHDQTFHADDCLSIYLLRHTKEFKDAKVIRTRNQAILDKCDCVCDVGGVYNHEKRRYDHHQKTFKEKIGSTICASCGIIYKHFGKEIIANILTAHGKEFSEGDVDELFDIVYKGFVQEIDMVDNGWGKYPGNVILSYETHTSISNRIAMLNQSFTTPDPVNMVQFEKASALIGGEFEEYVLHSFIATLQSIHATRESFEKRFEVDESGQIVLLPGQLNDMSILKKLEDPKKPILFVVSPQYTGKWYIKTICDRGQDRKKLPFGGMTDQELSDACGIPGGVFVHKTGFLAGFQEKEQAVAFAKFALKYEN